LQDEKGYADNAACIYRFHDSVLFEPGERLCRLYCDNSLNPWGVTVELMAGQAELAALNLAHANDIHICFKNYLLKLHKFAPVGLSGNPSDLLFLCLLMQEHDIHLTSVRFVMSAGENLNANTKKIIESTLGCKVFNVYSSQEFGCVAWECEFGKLHVNDDRVIVETLDGPLVPSELVITSLTNNSMSLIRYRTNDIGRYVPWEESQCQCGRELGCIEEFTGRDRGFVVLSDGTLFGPKPIKAFLTEQPILIWQIIQNNTNELIIHLVEGLGGDSKELLVKIEAAVSTMIGGKLNVKAVWVDKEDLLIGSGKFQMMHLNCSVGKN
jgi:phenylacetate-coenzyme A ligase PaaK-like adenylate-forming protein